MAVAAPPRDARSLQCDFDEILAIRNVTFRTNVATASVPRDDEPALEVLLARILAGCDMIHFVGETLVLEGPVGAIECTLNE